MLTGIGGGIVRGVLMRDIPTVLRTELYAVAALSGAAVVGIGLLPLPSQGTDVAGAVFCWDICVDRFARLVHSTHLLLLFLILSPFALAKVE